MKIKNVFLASLLSKIGVDAKAELVIDDANGTALTFPNISDVAEIAEGVAIDAPDGTYTVPFDESSMTIVVVGGIVTSVSTDQAESEEPSEAEASVSAELDAEVQTVLEAITDEVVALKASNVSLVAELRDLKASLKHDVEKPAAAAAVKSDQPKFKLID